MQSHASNGYIYFSNYVHCFFLPQDVGTGIWSGIKGIGSFFEDDVADLANDAVSWVSGGVSY